MMTEDVLTNLIEKASGNITLSFVRLFGNVEIHISAKGEKFDASAIEESMLLKEESADEDTNEVIHNLVSKWFGEYFSFRYVRGINKITIKVKASRLRNLIFTLLALIGGVAAGLLIHEVLPEQVEADCFLLSRPENFWIHSLNAGGTSRNLSNLLPSLLASFLLKFQKSPKS